MPNYPGKRKGTRRIVIWAKLEGEEKSKPHEFVVEGSKRDGDDFEAKKRIELNSQKRTELRTVPTFVSFCVEHYAPHARTHLKAGTWERRRYQVETLCKFFGERRLSEITISDVERFKDARLRAARTVKPISINGELSLLRTVLDYAESLGVAVPKLAWKRLPEHGRGRVLVWNRGEVDALYEAARKVAPEILPLLVFLLNTGVRKGEAIACEWSWIDFERDMIRIPANEFWSPKSGKPREIPMGAAVRAVLAGPRRSERWVFPNAWGRRFRDFPHAAFWAARDKAGLRGGPHTTRHTFASHFLAAFKGSNALQVLADLLGHSHTKVTEIYSHLLPGHLDEARDAVNLSPGMKLSEKKSTGRA